MKKIAAALGAILLVTGVKAQKKVEVNKTTTPQEKNKTITATQSKNIKLTQKVFQKSTLKNASVPANSKLIKATHKQLKNTGPALKGTK